jgi:3-methyladenine DNA glycosylase AlkD
LLKEQGINYFLINKNNIGVGGIAHSSLFSDKFINSYLKIIMENENWKVLTWLDNKIPGKALNKEELRNWMQLRSRESSFPELYNQVKKIYIYNNELTNIKPILPPGLSPVMGWQ